MIGRILHYSDPHFGACDPRVAEAAVRVAGELLPDLMVVSGDFSMRARRREMAAAHAWLQRLPGKPIVYPGNHDVPGLNHPIDRFFAPFRRYRKYLSETEEPSIALPDGGRMVTANSSTPFGLHLDWSLGFLSPFQAARIGSEFAEVTPDALRILGIHHPLLASGAKKRATVSPLALVAGVLSDARVDLVLCGHLHQSKVGVFPGVDDDRSREPEAQRSWTTVVSQSPSICSTRLKGEPNGFHVIDVAETDIRITLWRWRSGEFAPREKSRWFHRSELGWRLR